MRPATGRASRDRALRRADRPHPGRPVTVTGAQGSLRWGYRVAATIRDWTVTRTRKGGTLRGGVESHNAAYAYQAGLYFVTLTTSGAWQWPVRRLELTPHLTPHRIVAELGPQEKER
jgi:hypothetical protein